MLEKKQAKIFELQNLIAQYNAGERENINADEYPTWVLIVEMLKKANIEEGLFEEFLEFPAHFKIEEGQIIFNPDWQAEAEQAELKRIGNLHITKQDFFLQLCKPAGIEYEVLLAKISELNMKAEWELCNHVYYGVIRPFLSALPLGKTEKEIIAVFEALCKE